MSLLIKGRKMPYSCAECIFCHDLTGYGDCECPFRIDTDAIKRPANCPLIELPPHGRLIDGDVAEVITYTNESGDFADGILYAADWIADQPTVIEADDTVKTPLYDIVEEHANCHVQVLKNSITGEISIGWWKEEE